MKKKFIVEIDLPEDVTITEMKNYIYDSVATMCGSLHPLDDSLFDIDRESIKVVTATRCKAAALLEELK